jgi:hypothetical protein
MNRRSFLERCTLLVAAAGLPLDLLQTQVHNDDARTVGYLDLNDPRCIEVDAVFLNGVERRDVFALNDEEGWIAHYDFEASRRLHDHATAHSTRIAYGEVRVIWRQHG